MEKRTAEDFVEDLVSDGRSLVDILAVVLATHWNQEKEQIKEIYKNLIIKFTSLKR